MSRKKLLWNFILYLGSLFLVSSLTLVVSSFYPVYFELLIVFAFLFSLITFPFVLWFLDLRQTLHALSNALQSLGPGNWDASLPSSDIAEVWDCISSLHQSRQTLREKFLILEGEKEKLAGILSNLREGILVSDPANRMLIANAGAKNLLKITDPDFIGKSLDSLLTGDFKPIFETLIRGEEKSGTISPSDSASTLFFRSFLLKNPEGDLIGKVAVLYDITEPQRLEEMRKAFVANASHELRSPAAGLQAILDAFHVGGLDDPEQRKKFMGMMEREIDRLNLIIRDLLDLSELEREKEFVKEPFNVVKLFRECLESYEPQLQQKGIVIHQAFQNPELVIQGSPPDIEKLFRNLVDNAIKYTAAGRAIEIGAKQEGGLLEGWVQDSGIGIPKEHRDRIFERFYRVDKSRSRTLGGTGLGLSIAKHAVERHGGKIWVESEENQGSTFRFLLPLTQP